MSSNQNERLEEFMVRFRRIENELELLKEEKQTLFNDFKEVFEPKVLREAVRSVKARIRLRESLTELDNIVEQLEKKFSL
tara:strand:- start:816 stop:1055 length:240 start_codon:yes stop_codon:yes gene_type:complete